MYVQSDSYRFRYYASDGTTTQNELILANGTTTIDADLDVTGDLQVNGRADIDGNLQLDTAGNTTFSLDRSGVNSGGLVAFSDRLNVIRYNSSGTATSVVRLYDTFVQT